MTRDEAIKLVQENDNLRRFLNVLSITEGTSMAANPYLAQGGKLGGMLSTGYEAHPRALGQGIWEFKDKLGRKLKSTANGKYAITYPTWQGIEKAWGKMEFSPASQDAGAVYLIDQQGALNDVLQGNWDAALPKLGNVWASLPTAPDSYQQFRHTWDGLQNAFAQAGLQYTPGQTNQQTGQVTNPVVRYPALDTGMMMANIGKDDFKPSDFLKQMMQPPKQQQSQAPYAAARNTEPQEYATIQWLSKPTGVYGW